MKHQPRPRTIKSITVNALRKAASEKAAADFAARREAFAKRLEAVLAGKQEIK